MSRDRLVFMALVALDEVADRAGTRPIEAGFEVRLLLAFLYAAGNGERWLFDSFWRECRRADEPGWRADQSRYCRATALRSAWRGIARSVGAPETVEFDHKVRDAWRRRHQDAGVKSEI